VQARILLNKIEFIDGRLFGYEVSFECLNSVSPQIIFLHDLNQGRLQSNDKVVFIYAGVGWSFGAKIWPIDS